MTSVQPPLDQPLYGASLGQAVGRFFRKYATFTGRASRSEFWWVFLFRWLIITVGAIGSVALGAATQSEADRSSNNPGPGALILAVPLVLFLLAILVPSIALQVRRLHDANLPGPLVLIVLVPSLGALLLAILALLPTSPAGARFDAGAAPTPYPATPNTTPGYTPTPSVQAGPPPQASPPPAVPPVDPPTA